MRRYAVVEKAKDADVIGILVGTLGVGTFLPLPRLLFSLLTDFSSESSRLSSLDKTSQGIDRFPPEEELYRGCWETESCEISQFHGGGMLRAGRLS